MSSPIKTVTTVTTTKQKAKRSPPGQGSSRSARRRRALRSRLPTVGGASVITSSFMQRFAACLNNPFKYPPERIGLGTLVRTDIGVARLRIGINSNNVDGSLLVMLKTNAHFPLAYSNQASGSTPVWNNVPDGSWTSAQSTFSAARPLALGILVTPAIAATSLPAMSACSMFSYNDTQVAESALQYYDQITHATWYGSHYANVVPLPSGGSGTLLATWKPQDLSNFAFDYGYLEDVSAQLTPTARVCPPKGPITVIAITGPTNTQYYMDVVYYYEALPLASGIVKAQQKDTDNGFSSIETFFNTLRKNINMETIGTLYNAYEAWMGMPSLSGSTHSMAHKMLLEVDEKKHSKSIAEIDDYLSSIDVTQLSDSDYQHLLHVDEIISRVRVSSLASSPDVAVGRGVHDSQQGSRIPILRK